MSLILCLKQILSDFVNWSDFKAKLLKLLSIILFWQVMLDNSHLGFCRLYSTIISILMIL